MKDTHMISLRRDLTKWGRFLNVCIPLKSRARLNLGYSFTFKWKMKKCLFSKRCWALRCDHCLHTKRKWTSEELHALGSKLPKRAGELPINHAGVSRWGSAGRTAMLWEEQGRCHGPLCQCDWSQTPLAAFLCESLLSSAHFTFSYCSPIYKIPASGLSQPILLSEEGKFTQTDLLTISWPAKCQSNIWNSGC